MPKIFVSSGMTRGSGLTDIKYIVKKNLVIGIQIQGEQYRMVLEGDQEAINKVLNRNFWFDLNADFPNHKIYPSENSLNKFGEKFKYRYVKINPELSISEVVCLVEKHIGLIASELQEHSLI